MAQSNKEKAMLRRINRRLAIMSATQGTPLMQVRTRRQHYNSGTGQHDLWDVAANTIHEENVWLIGLDETTTGPTSRKIEIRKPGYEIWTPSAVIAKEQRVFARMQINCNRDAEQTARLAVREQKLLETKHRRDTPKL